MPKQLPSGAIMYITMDTAVVSDYCMPKVHNKEFTGEKIEDKRKLSSQHHTI